MQANPSWHLSPSNHTLCIAEANRKRSSHTTLIHKNFTMSSLATLQKLALRARQAAHAPYSRFQVGAALEAKNGEIFTGCNVENLSFGLTLCAERTAVVSAVAAGVRAFRRILIVADSREPIAPCGACRQVLAEFACDMEVISVNLQGKKYRTKLSLLLPRAKVGILDKPCST